MIYERTNSRSAYFWLLISVSNIFGHTHMILLVLTDIQIIRFYIIFLTRTIPLRYKIIYILLHFSIHTITKIMDHENNTKYSCIMALDESVLVLWCWHKTYYSVNMCLVFLLLRVITTVDQACHVWLVRTCPWP